MGHRRLLLTKDMDSLKPPKCRKFDRGSYFRDAECGIFADILDSH